MKNVYYFLNKKNKEAVFFNSLRKVEGYIKEVYPDIPNTISHNTISTKFKDKDNINEIDLPILKYYDLIIFKDNQLITEDEGSMKDKSE